MARHRAQRQSAGKVGDRGGVIMFRTAKNLLILLLIFDGNAPDLHPVLKNLIAQVGDEMGLLPYPEVQTWQTARELWGRVKASNGRPLSEMLRFPQGFVGDRSLYLQVLHGIIGPVRWKLRDEVEEARGEYRDRLFAYYERVSLHYRVYDLLDDLGRDTVPLWAKRIKLAELLEILGPDAYHTGRIPDPLP